MIVTPNTINRMYADCLLRHASEEGITVRGPDNRTHNFHKGKIDARLMQIVSALKKLPQEMRRSHSPQGVPWTKAIGGAMSLDTAGKLLSMGMAAGAVRTVPQEGIPCDLPFVVVDDLRISRQERTRPAQLRRYGLIRWTNGKIPERAKDSIPKGGPANKITEITKTTTKTE